MKKLIRLSFIVISVIAVFIINNNFVKAQTKGKVQDENNFNYEEPPEMKYLFFDGGYGANGASLGLGMRYSYFGGSINMTGFSKGIPAYSTDYYTRPTKESQIGLKENFSNIILNVDGGLYLDIDPSFTVFATLGLFLRSDSVLVQKNNSSGVPEAPWYPWSAQSSSGITVGLGMQYYLEEYFGFGMGYQTKKGFYLQIGYFWY
jgi:hypothetical protein